MFRNSIKDPVFEPSESSELFNKQNNLNLVENL